MAKKSGSKSSRNERRAGRKRAERAREHGLPIRRDAPQRARASTPQPGSERDGDDRSSDAPPARAPKPAGIPTLVKVVGGALVILIGVYLLSRQRDEALTETKPAPELPAASAVSPPEPDVAPSPALAASASAAAAPPADAPTPSVSVTSPTKPVVVAPVVPTPEKPIVAAPKPPARVAAPAPVAVPAAPVAAPAPKPPAPAPPAVAPQPAAPKPAAPAKPQDNPY